MARLNFYHSEKVRFSIGHIEKASITLTKIRASVCTASIKKLSNLCKEKELFSNCLIKSTFVYSQNITASMEENQL
jgi:hypothetical protein